MSVGKWFGFGLNSDYDEGLRLHSAGKYADAIPFFEKVVLTKDPQIHRQAHFYLAECVTQLGITLLRTEDFEGARGYLERACELHPTFPDVRLNLALAYRGLNRRTEMNTELREALVLNPRFTRAQFLRGLALYEAGDIEIGLAAMMEVGASDPLFSGDRFEAGLNNHELGDRGTAVAHWNVLLILERNDAGLFIRIGDQFARKELWEQASMEYEMALELEPTFADVRVKYGQALLELNHVHRAVAEFEKAIELNENYADAHAMMGVALRRLGEIDRAKSEFKVAVTINPDHVIAVRELTRLR